MASVFPMDFARARAVVIVRSTLSALSTGARLAYVSPLGHGAVTGGLRRQPDVTRHAHVGLVDVAAHALDVAGYRWPVRPRGQVNEAFVITGPTRALVRRSHRGTRRRHPDASTSCPGSSTTSDGAARLVTTLPAHPLDELLAESVTATRRRHEDACDLTTLRA